MRLTDAADGNDNQVAYSYWPTFNKNSTRAIANTGQGFTVFQIDPVTFRRLGKQAVPPAPNGSVLFEDAIWSGTNPDILYAHTLNGRLYSYNVATRAFTLVKDFNAQLPREYQWQMSKSIDDNVFAFTRRDSSTYAVRGYVVWRRDTGQLVKDAGPAEGIDEVHIDKTGRYLFVNTTRQGAGVVEGQVRDMSNGLITNLKDNGPDFNPSHSDLGTGTIIGNDNWNNRMTKRNLATPHTFSSVLNFGNDWSLIEHMSMLATDESWGLISFYGTSAPPGLFRGEIVQYKTDGSQQLRRLAHHRAVYRDYMDTPRANISRDGCFVAFTSNWGGSSRRDVFILSLKP